MKLKLIGLGGCGSNIVSYLNHNMQTEERSEHSALYVDTSYNNATDEMKADKSFFHIQSSDIESSTLSGSGGIRKTNHPHIAKGVEEFINQHQLHRSKDLIVLVSSLSGGSGNVILSEMLKKLLKTDAVVIGLVVADSTSKKYIDNSLESFITLNTVATKINPLPVLYFNNKVYQKNFDSDKVKMANKDILTVMNTLSIFTSGLNKDIDDKDMEFLFKPQHYNVRKGIYGLSVGKCELNEKELHDKRALLGRTLLAPEAEAISPLANYGLLQYKEGRTNAHIEDVDHIDILLTDDLDNLYASLEEDKNNFVQVKSKSAIPVEEDEFA